MYWRFFDASKGAMAEKVAELQADAEKAGEAANSLVGEYGGQARIYRDGTFAGAHFEKEPDRMIWKQKRDGSWWPKLNSKKGREIAKRFSSVEKLPTVDDALLVAGISPHSPVFLDEPRRVFYPHLRGDRKGRVLVLVVPWMDTDPDELGRYKVDREKGRRMDATLDHLLWEPPAWLVEVKEWEAKKALDEVGLAA